MPSPTSPLTTLSPDLNTFFEYDYSESEARFVGTQVLPVLNVPRQAGAFGRITIESLLEHSTSTRRAATSGYNRRQYEFTEDSWATEEHGIEEILDDREIQMYTDYLDAEAVATRRAVNSILTAHEQRVAAIVMDTVFYAGLPASFTVTPAAVWTDLVTPSTPLVDIETAWTNHRDNTGMRPNAIIMNELAFRALRNHPDVTDRIKSEGAGDQARARDVNLAQLSAVLDLDHIIVGSGMFNNSNPNVAADLQDVWPNHALVCRIAETNDIQEPCLGRTFHWSGDGSNTGGLIETYREEAIRSRVIRVRHETQEKMLHQELGVIIPTVV